MQPSNLHNTIVLNMFSLKFISKIGEGRRRPFLLVLALLASFLVLLALNGRDNVKDVLSKGRSWRKPIGTSKSGLKSLYPSYTKSLRNSSLGVRIRSRCCMKHSLTFLLSFHMLRLCATLWVVTDLFTYIALSSKKSLS